MVASGIMHPSCHQALARGPGESTYPDFWNGLRGAWVPGIRLGGLSDLQNYARRGYSGVQTNIAATDWVVGHQGYNGYALDIESTDTVKIPAGFLVDNFGDIGSGDLTMSVFLKPTENVGFCPVLDTTGRHMTLMYSVGADNQGFIGIGTAQSTVQLRLTINEWSLLTVVRKDLGANPTAFGYVNGTETFNTTNTGTTFSAELEICGNPSGGGTIKNRLIGAVYIWRRALSVGEIGFLSRYPFAPFQLRPSRARLSIPPTADTLNTLTLDADGTIDAVIENDLGDTPVFDHGNDAPDGLSSDYIQNDNSETSGFGWFRLSDVNADFDSMDTLNIDVDVQAVTFSDDTCTLTARIFAADNDTANPLTAETGNLATHADSTRVQRNVAFASLAGTKTQWNGAYIRFSWTYIKTGGPDNANLRLFGCDIDGTYNAIAVGGPPAGSFALMGVGI